MNRKGISILGVVLALAVVAAVAAAISSAVIFVMPSTDTSSMVTEVWKPRVAMMAALLAAS